jgi:8-oxo-dGTP pyrophosphatase MutT (NUDIX family)
MTVVARYLREFPDEEQRLSCLQEFLREITDRKQLFDRKNFNGHITASGFVVSPGRDKLAVVEHPSLKRRLQPGGHVEHDDESILSAAIREIHEETNLRAFKHILYCDDPHFPLDIDTHEIPANPKKNEPRHFHHDFRFLFQTDELVEPAAADWSWQPLETAIAEESYQFAYRKIRRLFDKL